MRKVSDFFEGASYIERESQNRGGVPGEQIENYVDLIQISQNVSNKRG